MTIGKRIYEIRNEKQLTQKQLADMCGFSQSAVNFWESGKRKPKMEQLQKIADALNVPLQELFKAKINENTPVIDLTELEVDDIGNYLTSIFPRLKGARELEEKYMQQAEDFTDDEQLQNEQLEALIDGYLKLNELGQKEAVKRVEELAEIPRYTI